MYLNVTNNSTFFSNESEREEQSVYLLHPHLWDRWAIKRLTASRPRFIVQNLLATAVVLASTVFLMWFLVDVVFWVAMVFLGLTIAFWIVAAVYALEKEEYTVSLLYTMAAMLWLEVGHDVIFPEESRALRALVGQLDTGTSTANASVSEVHRWLKMRPELAKSLDRLLSDPWIIEAETTLDKLGDDTKSVGDRVKVMDGIATKTWLLAKGIGAADKATLDARRSHLSQLADSAPRVAEGDWNQPSGASTPGKGDLR